MITEYYSNIDSVSNNSLRMRAEAEVALARAKQLIARSRAKHPTRMLRVGDMLVECSESRVQEFKQYSNDNKLEISDEYSRESI